MRQGPGALNQGCAGSRKDSALAPVDKSTAGNGEWMDVLFGNVPDVTADFMRKAFYTTLQHVANDPTPMSPSQAVSPL